MERIHYLDTSMAVKVQSIGSILRVSVEGPPITNLLRWRPVENGSEIRYVLFFRA
jgi:hypothetical protein